MIGSSLPQVSIISRNQDPQVSTNEGYPVLPRQPLPGKAIETLQGEYSTIGRQAMHIKTLHCIPRIILPLTLSYAWSLDTLIHTAHICTARNLSSSMGAGDIPLL